MKTINLNKHIENLDGTENEAALNKVLAQLLANSETGDALKFWEWAKLLHADKELTLDPSDFETLVKFVKECKLLTVAGRAQLLIQINAAKEA